MITVHNAEQEESTIFPVRNVYEYGSFGRRLLAVIIDSIIMAIPTSIISTIIGHNWYSEWVTERHVTIAASLSLLIQEIMYWLYYALMESSNAQGTIGKMAMSLKVTDLQGNRVSFARATGRFFGRFVSTIILFLGYFMMLWDEKRQTLHDKMAGTLVVKKINPVLS